MKTTIYLTLFFFLSSMIGLQAQTFTWTDVNGEDFTTTGKDQRIQGPCYVHAAAALIESMYEIENSVPLFEMDVSEPYLYSACVLDVAEAGKQIETSLTHIRDFGVVCQDDHPDYPPTCPSIAAADSTFADCISCFFDCIPDSSSVPPFCNQEASFMEACNPDECSIIQKHCFDTQGYTMEIIGDCISYFPTSSQTRVRITNFEHLKGTISNDSLINLIQKAPFAIHFKDANIHTLNGVGHDHAYVVVGFKVINGSNGPDTLWHVKDSWPQLNNRFRFLDFDLKNVIATNGAFTAQGVYCQEQINGQWQTVPCGCGNPEPLLCEPDQNPNVSVNHRNQQLFNPTSNIDLCNALDGNILTINLANDPDYLANCIIEIEWDAVGIGGSPANGVDLLPVGNNLICDAEFLQDGTYGISVRFKYNDGTWSAKRWVYVDFVDYCSGGGELGLNISPNPGTRANDVQFKIKSTKENQLKTLSVFDLNGKVVFQQAIYATQEQLILSSLDEGLYIVQLINEEGKKVHQKLIIR